MIMVSEGNHHTSSVTESGSVWTWGNGCCNNGQLGHDDGSLRQPYRFVKDVFGNSPAITVSCGALHTLVLTMHGLVWSCSWRFYGQLGHGNNKSKQVLTLIEEKEFTLDPIVMVSASTYHNAALGKEGSIWTWGNGYDGGLGDIDYYDNIRDTPLKLTEHAFAADLCVFVQTGTHHSLTVTRQGNLWVWGNGEGGCVGMGDEKSRLIPTLVQPKAFGGLPVVVAGCGPKYTLVITNDGCLWSLGENKYCNENKLVPTRTDTQGVHYSKLVSLWVGEWHSAAVTENGIFDTWDNGSRANALNTTTCTGTTYIPWPLNADTLNNARVGASVHLDLNINIFVRGSSSIRFHVDQKRRFSCCRPFSELFDCIQQNICILCSY